MMPVCRLSGVRIPQPTEGTALLPLISPKPVHFGV